MTDLVNTGIYIVSPRAMAYVPEDQPFDFAKDLFPLLLAAHEPILGVPMDGYWCDIGTPRAYYRCSLDVLDGRLSPAQPRRFGRPAAATPARRPEPPHRPLPRPRAPDAHGLGGHDGGRGGLYRRAAPARRRLGAEHPAGRERFRPAGRGKRAGRRCRDGASARTDGAGRKPIERE
ncbi:MAG: NDP-sugar synthase [Oscillospiraceae bacterium]